MFSDIQRGNFCSKQKVWCNPCYCFWSTHNPLPPPFFRFFQGALTLLGPIQNFFLTLRGSLHGALNVQLVVVEWSASLALSTRRSVVFLRYSLRMLSEMLSPTPNTPRGRLSQETGENSVWFWRIVSVAPSSKRSCLGPQTILVEYYFCIDSEYNLVS